MNAANAFPINQLDGLEQLKRRSKISTLSSVLGRMSELYRLACEARLTVMEGDSKPADRNWRGMLVGAVALVKLEDGEWVTVTGFNTKRTQRVNCPSRRCAEERILAELHRIDRVRKVVYIAALVVVGDFQVDDKSGVHCTTLHPCGNCRRKLELDEFMRPLTLIITAQPPNELGQPDFAEIHTRDDLFAKHRVRGHRY